MHKHNYRKLTNTETLAKNARKSALKIISKADVSHVGSCLSLADILAVLYGRIVNVCPCNIKSHERDRVIISKGHAAAIVYSVLAECGFFPKKYLETFCEDGSRFIGHITHFVSGIEVSTGSLGHGLSIGLGMALAAKRDRSNNRVFVVLSDGELDAGSTWEAILFAPQHGLDNLIALVDYNKLQGFGAVKDVINLEPLADKWRVCNWSVKEIDGHDHRQIYAALKKLPLERGKPSVVIAHTIKGKGVSFMENRLEWHYRSPNKQQLEVALNEIEQK